VIAHPVDDEMIRREQAQLIIGFDGLQRPDPGIEILLRQVALEGAQALVPKGRTCRRVLSPP
jgi:hypothetical protein